MIPSLRISDHDQNLFLLAHRPPHAGLGFKLSICRQTSLPNHRAQPTARPFAPTRSH